VTNYVVQPGDTLFSIAVRFGTTVEAIKAANGLTSDLIYVGQTLRIPGTGPWPTPSGPVTTYVVQPYDTLFSIAVRFGTTVEAIKAANGLTSDLIYIGQTLRIPGAGPWPTPSGVPTEYIVQPGDNLFRIALRFGTTWQAIAQANGLYNPNFIYVGQRLIIPSGSGSQPPSLRQYVVQPGDTLFSIATRFGTTWEAIAAANNIWNPDWIYVGQVLRIP